MNDEFRRKGAILQNLADACRSDEDRLRQVEERPKDVLREHGIDVPEEVDVNVVLNTHDTFHLAMPPDPNHELSDEALSTIAGGKTLGCWGSIATGSTLASTVLCFGTAGSAGSFDPNAD